MFKNLLSFGVIVFLIIISSSHSFGQCENPTVNLPDANHPVDGNLANGYCVTLMFDPAFTGFPTGIEMDLTHTFEGDLSITVTANGNTLSVMQRPGAIGNCTGGCTCGSSDNLNGTYSFEDGGGPDPEPGLAPGGGAYGVTADDGCGVNSPGIASFADLWSTYGPGETVSAEICITDHAGADVGVAANITFLFPNPILCGCTDIDAINFDPNASVDDGSCFYDCPDLGLDVAQDYFEFCAGTINFNLAGDAPDAVNPSYQWTADNGGGAFIQNPNSPNTQINIPDDFDGTIFFTLTVFDEFGCEEEVDVEVNVGAPPEVEISGPDQICLGELAELTLIGGPYDQIYWPETGDDTETVFVDPGTHTVVVEDEFGCENTASFVVDAFPAVTPLIFGPDEICAIDGEAILEADDFYESYEWSTGETSFDITVTESGEYELTVEDENGCFGETFFVLDEAPPVEVNIIGDDEICEGDISFLQATFGFVNYEWDTGETTPDIQVNFPDTYSVTVEDDNGCFGETTFDLTVNPLPDPVIDGPSVLCPGETISLSTEEMYSSYDWTTGSVSQSTTVNNAGTVSVTVTDNSGCSNETEVEIIDGGSIDASIDGNLYFCPDGDTQLTATPGFDSYSWSNGDSGNEVIIDQADTYDVTITNSEGCTEVLIIDVEELDAPAPVITGDDYICFETFTSLEVANIYDAYEWSTGDMTNEIFADQTDVYSVTVTDNFGCTGEDEFTLTVGDEISPEIVGPSELCPNALSELSITGSFMSVDWSNGFTNSNIAQIVGPGDYSVDVVDNNGCPGTSSITIEEREPEPVDIIGDSEICEGTSHQLSTSAGFVDFLWSTDETSSAITINDAGIYWVIAIDEDGCESYTDFTVSLRDSLVPIISGEFQFCPDGSTVLSTQSDFDSYSWTGGGSSNEELTVSTEGDYSVTVMNDDGCQGEATVFVDELVAPTPEIVGDLILCEDETSTLSLMQNYSAYSWSTTSDQPTIDVTQGTTFSVTVTDGDGCTGEDSVTLEEIDLSVTISGDNDFCEGMSTTISVPNTFSSYAWSIGGDTPEINTSTGGNVSVTVTDENGCTATDDIDIVVYPLPIVDITGDLSFCAQEETQLSATPGYPTYLWSNSANISAIDVSQADDYSVTVTDENGCQEEALVTVEELALPTPEILGDFILCEDEISTLTLSENYASYNWSTSSDQASIDVDQGITYSVTVTDNDGCVGEDSATLEDIVLSVEISGDDDFCDGMSTSISVPANFSSYAWSTGGDTPEINTSTGGNVSIIVTDENGCTATDDIDLTVFDLPVVDITGRLTYCPNGATVLNATPGFSTYAWSNSNDTESVQVSEETNYSVTVTDSNGCQDETSVYVAEEPELDIEIIGDDDFCIGSSTTLSVVGEYVSYAWSNNSDAAEITVSEGITYAVVVTDEFGCTGEDDIAITSYPLPEPTITGDLNFCVGENTQLNGGNYEAYQWSVVSQDTQFIEIGVPQMIGLTVTDENGCVGSTAEQLIEDPLPVHAIQGIPGFCPDETTTLSGEPGFEIYSWNTSSNATSIIADLSQTYELSVTDENGCVGVATIDVSEYMTSLPQIQGADQFCPEGSTNLTVSNTFENYNWTSGEITDAITTSMTGTIGVLVTDSNGCLTENSVELSLFNVVPPVIDAVDGFCTGTSATLTATAGYSNYSWSDSNNQQTAAISVSDGGLYTVDVIDINGCASDAVVSITEYDLPEPAIGGSLTFCTGLSTTLNPGGVYTSYAWSTGDTGSEVVVDIPGNIGLTVTDENNCVGNTNEIVEEATELSPVISGESDFCTGETTELSAGNGFATYLWSNGSIASSIIADTAGLYTLSVTDDGGCDGTAELLVVENDLPQPEIQGLLAFCEGLETDLSSSEVYATYEWSTGAPTPTITVNVADDYVLTVTDENDCVNMVMVSVEEQPLPIYSIVGDDEFCISSSTELSIEPAYTTYNWSTGSDQQTINTNNSGIVAVTVTDEFGCLATQNIQLSTVDLPLADAGNLETLDCEILSVEIGGSTNPNGNYSYLWSGPGINAMNATLLHPEVDTAGEYSLIITNEDFDCVSLPALVTVEDAAFVPQIEIEVLDVLDCVTQTVQVDARNSDTGQSFVYQWFDGNLNPISNANSLIYVATTPQFYTLQIIDTITSCSNMAGMEVEEDNTYPYADAGLPQLITCGSPVVTLDGTASEEGGQIEFTWTSEDGSFVGNPMVNLVEVNAPGLYFLQVEDVINGCGHTDSVFVSENVVYPIAATSDNFELNCLVPTTLVDGQGSSVGSIYSYQWMHNQSSIDDANQLQLEVDNPGLYTLQVTNIENDCVTEDAVEITLNPAAPQSLSYISDRPTCAGDSDGSILITGTEGGTPPFLYSMQGGPYTGLSPYENLSAGVYEVVVEDAIGCLLYTEVEVIDGNDLRLELGPDQYLLEGDLADIYPQISLDSSQLVAIDWQTTAVLDCQECIYQLDLKLDQSTQFFLSLRDENGCKVDDDITIYIEKERPIYVPTAFSPNEDGDNDIFYVFSGDDNVKIHSFLVFNRWGEAVFEVYNSLPNDPRWGWDGKHRGQPVNSAVYVWFAEVEFANGDIEVIKGDVTVMH